MNDESKEDYEKIPCACCGTEMNLEKKLQKSNLYRCNNCGISDTRLNS